MTKAEIQSKIEKAKKGLTNKHLTDSQKEALAKGITQLEAQLAELDKVDPEESAPEATADKGKEDSKEPVKKDSPKKDKPKAKKKITKENKAVAKSDCDKVEAALSAHMAAFWTKRNGKRSKSSSDKPKTKKRTSEVIAEGFVAVFKRAITSQLTLDKAPHLKIAKIEDARDKVIAALKDLRQGFGGVISSDNDTFIEDFKTEVNKFIAEAKEKQKQAEESKQAA